MTRPTSPVSPLLPILLLLGLSGCGGGDRRPVASASGSPPATATGWRAIATVDDRRRLRTWRDAWVAALAKANAAGNGSAIAAQGALLQPDVALPDPTPPPGAYRCRVSKLGAVGGTADYVAYPFFRCRIDAIGDGTLRLSKLDGSQRPTGILYPGNDGRMVFLGTMVLGDETRAIAYGRDRDRDMAGTLERIGARRWRLSMPWPRWESMLDVVELLPS